MKLEKNKDLIIRLITIALALIMVFGANRVLTGGDQLFGELSVAPVYPATVDAILAKNWTTPDLQNELQVHFEATITKGEKKGESVLARQFISSMYVSNHKMVEEGDSILVRYTDYDQENIWVMQQYNQTIYIAALLLFFVALLFVFGGKKGFYTLVALVLTFTCLFFYFIPSILTGQNIYISALITCVFIMAITLILVNGINQKTISAAVGTFGGVLVSGVIFKIMDSILHLTGVVDEEASYLLVMNSEIELKGIMFAATVISALGASLDVGVSIASSLSEMYTDNKKLKFKDVFKSGINIGQDIISTMTNTLILVYVGSALSGTLLLTMYSNSFLELINREGIIFEVLQALIGSIGVLFAIPITSAFYALLCNYVPKVKSTAQKNIINKKLVEPEELVANKMPGKLKKLAGKNKINKKSEKRRNLDKN